MCVPVLYNVGMYSAHTMLDRQDCMRLECLWDYLSKYNCLCYVLRTMNLALQNLKDGNKVWNKADCKCSETRSETMVTASVSIWNNGDCKCSDLKQSWLQRSASVLIWNKADCKCSDLKQSCLQVFWSETKLTASVLIWNKADCMCSKTRSKHTRN